MQKRHLHEFYRGECLGSPHTSYGGACLLLLLFLLLLHLLLFSSFLGLCWSSLLNHLVFLSSRHSFLHAFLVSVPFFFSVAPHSKPVTCRLLDFELYILVIYHIDGTPNTLVSVLTQIDLQDSLQTMLETTFKSGTNERFSNTF